MDRKVNANKAVEWSGVRGLMLWRFTCGWLVVGGFSCVVVLLDAQRNVNTRVVLGFGSI